MIDEVDENVLTLAVVFDTVYTRVLFAFARFSPMAYGRLCEDEPASLASVPFPIHHPLRFAMHVTCTRIERRVQGG